MPQNVRQRDKHFKHATFDEVDVMARRAVRNAFRSSSADDVCACLSFTIYFNKVMFGMFARLFLDSPLYVMCQAE